MDALEFLVAPVATVIVFAGALMTMHWRDVRGRHRAPKMSQSVDRPVPATRTVL